jgi:hypothetical protein
LQQHDPLVFELRVFVRDVGESLVDTVDQRCDLTGLVDRPADGLRLIFPGFEERVAVGLRKRRCDCGQLLVAVLVESGVGGDDQVGFQGGDLLNLNSVVQVEHNGFGISEFGLGPRPYPERLVAEPVGHRNRHDSECEQVVLSGEAGADYPLGRLGDRRLTEGVCDGERSTATG